MSIRQHHSARLVAALALAMAAVVLGAGEQPTGDWKQRTIDRMLEIGEEFQQWRAIEPSRDTRTAMEALAREYRALSRSLGGDDPAHMLDAADASNPAQGDAGGPGGIASAPPAPAGCTATTTSFSNASTLPIPGASPITVSTILVNGVSSFLWDVNLTTFILHSSCDNLDITLTSPAGTVVTITSDNGGTFDNVFNGTVWDDDANPAGQVPYADNIGVATDRTYANNVIATPLVPEEAMGAFIGENPNGTWTLRVSDDGNADLGSLVSWSLDVTTAPAAPVTTSATNSNTTALAIGSAGPVVVSSDITVGGAGSTITDVNVTTSITHTNAADLDITLRSPAGTVVTLTTDNGGSNDNVFNGTTWDDDANPAGQVPFTSNNGVASDHTYANNVVATPLVPEEAMAAFIGEDPSGTWTLTVSDDAAANGGSIDSWSLTLTSTTAPPATSMTTFTNIVPSTIDLQPIGNTLLVSGVGAYLWDVDLTTLLTHAACADVDMTLTSPAGTVMTITSDNAGTFDNVFNGTAWDDDANPAGQVPYSSNNRLVGDQTYANAVMATPLVAEEALAAFIGENPNGTWTLTVHDDSSQTDGGSLTGWTLNVTTLNAAPANDSPLNFANGAAAAISNGAPPVEVTSTVNVTGAGAFLCDANLSFNIAHTATGDLDITLTSPAGTVATISSDNGGANDNVFGGTSFDDDANPGGALPYVSNNGMVTDAAYVNATPQTPLTPEEALGAFIGENPNGVWTLKISDDTVGDGGTLNSWSLRIITCSCGGAPACPGNIVATGSSATQVDIDDLLAVIGGWGPCPVPPTPCPANIVTTGASATQVDIDDLLAVIGAWGPCP